MCSPWKKSNAPPHPRLCLQPGLIWTCIKISDRFNTDNSYFCHVARAQSSWYPRLARDTANSEFQSLSNNDPSWLCKTSVFHTLWGECWEITRPTPAVFRKYSADQLEVPENSNTGPYKSRQQSVSSIFACTCTVLCFNTAQKITYIMSYSPI